MNMMSPKVSASPRLPKQRLNAVDTPIPVPDGIDSKALTKLLARAVEKLFSANRALNDNHGRTSTYYRPTNFNPSRMPGTRMQPAKGGMTEIAELIQTLEAPGAHKRLVRGDKQFIEMLVEQNSMCVITDMDNPAQPIVYATRAFQQFTGYTPGDIIGQNCRFLSRPPACPEVAEELTPEEKEMNTESLNAIRAALVRKSREPVCVTLVNFKKDGTRFDNSFFMTALMNDTGSLVYFVGVQQVQGAQEMDCDQNQAYIMRRNQLATTNPKMWRVRRGSWLRRLFMKKPKPQRQLKSRMVPVACSNA